MSHIYPQPQAGDLNIDDQSQLLNQSDMVQLISLEQAYQYYSGVVKIEKYNKVEQSRNENNYMKVIHRLNDYYAKCISSAEANLDNIVKYFQRKMRAINAEYKQIVDKIKLKQKKKELASLKLNPLGKVQKMEEINIPVWQIKDQQIARQTSAYFNRIKANIDNAFLMARQNKCEIADRLEQAVYIALKDQINQIERRNKVGKIKCQKRKQQEQIRPLGDKKEQNLETKMKQSQFKDN